MPVYDPVPPLPVVPVALITASNLQTWHRQSGIVFHQLVARPVPNTLTLVCQRPHAFFKHFDPPVFLVKKAFQSLQSGHRLSPLLIGSRMIRSVADSLVLRQPF